MIPLRASTSRNFTRILATCHSHGRSHHAHQSHRIFELPEACTSEEWHSLLRESRGVLQKVRIGRLRPQSASVAPLDSVLRRLSTAENSCDHLLNTFRQLLENTDSSANVVRWPGILSLMVSRIAGNPFESDNFISKALEDIVWSSQVALAEVLNLLHSNIVFQNEKQRLSSTRKVTRVRNSQPNDIGRLVNGYFVSSALYKLAAINNCKVTHLISDVLESIAKVKSSRNISINNLPQLKTLDSWEYETLHPEGLLLAKGCQSALELAGHDEKTQKMAFEFGRNFSLALRANSNIYQFLSYQSSCCSSFEMNSLPVILHISTNPETLAYLLSCGDRLDNLDLDVLSSMIKSSNAIDVSKQQLMSYMEKSMLNLQGLKNFENSTITDNLVKLIETLGNILKK